MGLQYGGVTPNKIYYNNTEVKTVYYNNVKVWSSSILIGTLAVGNTVIFDNKSWIVVHNDTNNGYWYLAYSTVYSKVPFAGGEYAHTVFSKSYLAKTCNDFEINNMSAEALKYCIDTKILNYTSKIFVPTTSMVLSSASSAAFTYYYKQPNNRICTYNGEPCTWWISQYADSNGYFHCVDTDGTNKKTGYGSQNGFRPHICIVSP